MAKMISRAQEQLLFRRGTCRDEAADLNLSYYRKGSHVFYRQKREWGQHVGWKVKPGVNNDQLFSVCTAPSTLAS